MKHYKSIMLLICAALVFSTTTAFAGSTKGAGGWTKDKKISMSSKKIQDFNDRMRQNRTEIIDLSKAPATLKGSTIKKKIKTYSIQYKYTRRGYATKSVRAYYNRLRNLSSLKDSSKVNIRYALVTAPQNLRQYPTNDWLHISKRATSDRFQECMLQTGEGVYIMHYSKDRKWAFVHSKSYYGWTKISGLAYCSKENMLDYVNSDKFYIITKTSTGTLAGKKRTLTMGTKLAANEKGKVIVPCRNSKGQFYTKIEKLSSRFSSHKGYLAFSRYSLLRQAYKFKGSKYSWGMKHYGQDCSSTLVSTYSTFGIELPRDTSHMYRAKGRISLTGKSNKAKVKRIRKLKPGSILFYKGHAMMYLGYKQGKIYILHNTPPKCIVEPISSVLLKKTTSILEVK